MSHSTSTADEIGAFLDQLSGQAEIGDFIDNMGQDLVASGVLRKAEFSPKPGMLQVAKLRTKFRDSKVYVGDIEAGADWKGRQAEWWDAHGARLVIRVQKAWKTQAGGVGTVTDAIIRGQVLSKIECEEVVDDSLMAQLEEKLAAEDVDECKKLIVSTTRFGALFQRGWINFKEAGVSEKEAVDNNRRRLNSAFLEYSRLWSGKVLPGIFADSYTRRHYYPPKFFPTLHEQLTAFASGKGFEEGLLAAMVLMTEVDSVKELGSCSAQAISKALATAMKVYHAMLDDVGEAAGQHALDILEVWTDADPHFHVFADYYECKPGEEPLACVKTFVIPVIRDWMSEYWTGILKSVGGRETGAEFKTLEKTLSLDALRDRPRLGIRIFEERAADVRLTLAANSKRAKTGTGGAPSGGGTLAAAGGAVTATQQHVSRLKRPDLQCDHCGKPGHQMSACWQLHPELDPKTPEGKQMRLRDKARTRAEQARQMGSPGSYDWRFHGQYMGPPQGGFMPLAGAGYGQQYMHPPHGGVSVGGGAQPPAQVSRLPPQAVPPPPSHPPAQFPPGVMLAQPMGSPSGAPVPGGQKLCYKCGQAGHLAKHCPN